MVSSIEACRIESGVCCVGTVCSVTVEAGCLNSDGVFFGFSSTCGILDADGLRNECDGYPDDGNKIEPGACGCGVDYDPDADGGDAPDCVDACSGVDDTVCWSRVSRYDSHNLGLGHRHTVAPAPDHCENGLHETGHHAQPQVHL